MAAERQHTTTPMHHLSCMTLRIPNLDAPSFMRHTHGHACTVCHAVGLAFFTIPSMLGVSTGDGNCFYRALLAAMVEGLCLDPRPARIASLTETFMSQRSAVASCPVIHHQTKVLALQGYNFLQVPSWCQCLMLLVRHDACIWLSTGSSLMQLLHQVL